MKRRAAVAGLTALLVIGAVAAAFSAYSAYYKYDLGGANDAETTTPLQMFVDTGGNTRAFRNGQFGAVNIEVSEDEDGLFVVKITQQVVVKAKNYDPSRDRLLLHIDGPVVREVIEPLPDRAEVVRPLVLYFDDTISEGTVKTTMPWGNAVPIAKGQQSLDIPMQGRFFTPDETIEVDPTLSPKLRNELESSLSEKSGDSIFLAGAGFIVEPPVVKRLDSWERLLQFAWSPDLGEPLPIQSEKGLEVGVSLCDCAVSRIKSDSDRAFSTFNHQVISWKYSEPENLEIAQESGKLKTATKVSLWLLGAVMLGLLLSLLPMATRSWFGLAVLGRTATGGDTERAVPSQMGKGSKKPNKSTKRKK